MEIEHEVLCDENVKSQDVVHTTSKRSNEEVKAEESKMKTSEQAKELVKPSHKPGMAWLKPEYILPRDAKVEVHQEKTAETSEPPSKRQKTRGRNRKRPTDNRPPLSEKICTSILQERECRFGASCKLCHDIPKFMSKKPTDIGEKCYVFETFGRCHQSLACRYSKSHIDGDFKNIVNKELYDRMSQSPSTMNILAKDVQKLLWKRKYDFSKANSIVAKVTVWYQKRKAARELVAAAGPRGPDPTRNPGSRSPGVAPVASDVGAGPGLETPTAAPGSEIPAVLDSETSCVEDCTSTRNGVDAVNPGGQGGDVTVPSASRASVAKDTSSIGCLADDDNIKLRPAEKKKIDFTGKLYLAPLTTVGNLPFRRLCKRYGADITCGEMALATNLLQANQSEWALVKRHHSEDLFGVQLCGAYPDTMTRCAQLLNEVTSIDFVDINCGCPIDMVYQKGEGSALMGKPNKLEQIVKSMCSVLDVPLTLKMRTGIHNDKNVAHTLVPKLRDWGVANVTLHGRSREQRYTRLADWDYIDYCAQQAGPMSVLGNGDVLSYEDYYQHMDNTSVGGIVIARGALIKPWIFTEIKERRHWDISAGERLDLLKDFVNFGLEHWGSDQQGVDNCRRFLLEQLSFSYRYIPVGLMERLPQKVNERPPRYQGRSDLETLLSSPNCGDWIKISEMLLGPTPSDFSFLPKHKANSYH